MKKNYDEPLYIEAVDGTHDKLHAEVLNEIRTLCLEQPFAVLSTENKGQPYTSLISYAVSNDLKQLVFSTPAQTRKYEEIVNNGKVALMIDNRSNQPASINLIRGLTVTGLAGVLKNPDEITFWTEQLINRHSYLAKFVRSSSSRLILVEKLDFCYVRNFQEVYRWTP